MLLLRRLLEKSKVLTFNCKASVPGKTFLKGLSYYLDFCGSASAENRVGTVAIY